MSWFDDENYVPPTIRKRGGFTPVAVRRTLRDYPAPTPQPTPCRLWQGYLGGGGYGKYRKRMLHRWVWELAYGPIPPGMYICHRCDQPLCYRLDHLFLGTPAENTRDMVTKGRKVSHVGESNPRARLTEADVREIRASPLGRRDLAERYGVSQATIGMIRTRRNWAHVKDEEQAA